MKLITFFIGICVVFAGQKSRADQPFIGPVIKIVAHAPQAVMVLDRKLVGAKMDDRDKLPAATPLKLVVEFMDGGFVGLPPGVEPPKPPPGVKVPPPAAVVRNIMFEIKGPGVVRHLSNVRVPSPTDKVKGEKRVSKIEIKSLEEARFDREQRKYVRSNVYLTKPGKYTVRVRLMLLYARGIHHAVSEPITITVTKGEGS